MIVDILDRHDPRQVGLSRLFARVAEPLTKRCAAGRYGDAVISPVIIPSCRPAG
jgi:hypothetical protein